LRSIGHSSVRGPDVAVGSAGPVVSVRVGPTVGPVEAVGWPRVVGPPVAAVVGARLGVVDPVDWPRPLMAVSRVGPMTTRTTRTTMTARNPVWRGLGGGVGAGYQPPWP
jgi:hypothetical protein